MIDGNMAVVFCRAWLRKGEKGWRGDEGGEDGDLKSGERDALVWR